MQAGKRGKMRISICLLSVFLLFTLSSCRKSVPTYRIVAGKEGYTHSISAGETLESIAERYYGDRSFGRALGEYNGLDPDKPLEPGNTLLVPFDQTELDEIRSAQEAQSLYNRGTVLARTGQYEDAVTYLEQAVKTSPAYVDAWYNLALAYHRLDRLEEAGEILQRLVNSFPSEHTYRYSLGAVLRDKQDYEAALEQFRKALQEDPLYAQAQYALALTYEDLGKHKQASREWERYLEIDPDSIWSEEARIHLESLRSR
jgi:tetratricopeptide (TPR) repeat protein